STTRRRRDRRALPGGGRPWGAAGSACGGEGGGRAWGGGGRGLGTGGAAGVKTAREGKKKGPPEGGEAPGAGPRDTPPGEIPPPGSPAERCCSGSACPRSNAPSHPARRAPRR